jgi:hypothetical protein
MTPFRMAHDAVDDLVTEIIEIHERMQGCSDQEIAEEVGRFLGAVHAKRPLVCWPSDKRSLN